MTIRIMTLLLLIVAALSAQSQSTNFDIYLEPINIPNLPGLQSYAYGQHDGKWLIVGGRTDGLHQRQPFAAFDVNGNNTAVMVVDPNTAQVWSKPLSSLSVTLQEQLQSTNMQFYQSGNTLYVTGGYGFSTSQNAHTTYPYLTAIDVPGTIAAIVNNTPMDSYYRQITDSLCQVTGGRLEKLDSVYYLVGGHKFIGAYNPMGPNHGPGFFQEYTNAIRKFSIVDDGLTLSVTHYPATIDTNQLHRRDYNLVAQIFPNGAEGMTAFSGVFQKNVNQPFLNSVDIDNNSYTVNNSFAQYYNHYHCANLPLYSASQNEMHTLFFGGIAQYYDSAGVLVQNTDVPFVKTIARVTRTGNGAMAEYKMNATMPSLLGAGSELIANNAIPRYPTGVVKLDELTSDSTLAGYIYGGIESSAGNIFFINNGAQSSASQKVFKVWIIKSGAMSVHDLNEQSVGSLHAQVKPNPNNGHFFVTYTLLKPATVTITLYQENGGLIFKEKLLNQQPGNRTLEKRVKHISKGGVYLLTIDNGMERSTQKIVIEP